MNQLLVQRACAKLRSAIADEAVVGLDFTRDLRELLDALEVIQPGLEKHEMMFVSERRRLHERVFWMQTMSVAYKIMDMVDELQDTRPPAAATMTRMLPRRAIKKNAMATKVENMKNEVIQLNECLGRVWSSVEALSNAQEQQHQLLMDARLTGPFFEEASVFGRGADKWRIVAVLLSAASNIKKGPTSCTILPIFGLPGSGKTTLAQMVFNDDTHFLQEYNFRAWIHVSPELDFHRICESILCQVMPGGGEKEEINDHGSNSHVVGNEDTMKRLHELFHGTKNLLVLDDLWEEDPIQLQLLKARLNFLSDKMVVIVTTRSQATARNICTVEPYRLSPLDDDGCWEIIKKSICRVEDDDEELEKIGRKIARNCWGIAQLALEYASDLRDSRDLREWKNIMEENVWDRSSNFLQSFILSYMSMSPELRLCFHYCYIIFPNGHNIVKYDLVHQWIALDFIEPYERSSATEIAEGYITRLLDMSFFRTAKTDKGGGNDDEGAAMFKMHDMARDISKWMWPTEILYITPYRVVINCRGKLDYWYDSDTRALRCVGCSKVEFNKDSFSRYKYLCVLELQESSVHKLPDSICKLRHLRYLKISKFSGLVTLPESFGDLTTLLHIDLSGCSGLAALPESFGDLINLSHVNLSRCHGLAELPEPLQKLGKLVHLDLSFWSCFEGIGRRLGGLTNLQHLNLSHPCCHLAEQRSHLQGLKDGLCMLTNLRYLNLSMCLNPIFYYQSEQDSLQYIDSCVSSLSSLEYLDLSHNTFPFDLPKSLGHLNKLHTLNLLGCIRLKRTGEMKSLKFIALKNCRGLESCNFVVRADADATYRSSNLVQLEDVDCQELQISCLEKVRSKQEAQRIKLVKKQKLEKLKISWTLDSLRSVKDSALLGELTPPPNLQCLEIIGYDGTCLPEYCGDLTSLQELKIVCCKQLKSLPNSIQKLTNLEILSISGCQPLEKWCQLEENQKMLAHIPKKNYEEHGSTSRPEIEEDCRSINEVEAA